MNKESAGKSGVATGIKLLGVLAVGAASGGCWGGEMTGLLRIDPATAAALQAAAEAESLSSEGGDSEPQILQK